ncbi:hypothetical protein M409DRAFT_29638 [Zasmidium cellare ATCC 36951]|uniref:FAD-binding domain-containing protein n=1 Tax=Zasmidium cellare ATCC 36951 TaxID=1080233 RepID=A0A6A6C0N0_ZASCE|nr:uncharacterized protein M409DRAFT_29638 [Zasmidium cellare ATCC 36951]KAF2159828.1 hypothetical protein M409DRAFT_29638 [Zasmidium cellare ATCC 36951]
MASNEKVIIIGAGVSGLVLAQILRQGGVPYEVYDRDDGTHWQGWAISLDKCLQSLYPLLPPDIQDPAQASPNYHSSKPDGFWVVNAVTHESLGVTENAPRGHPDNMIHANRDHFRKIFMQNVKVQFGKTFQKYEESGDGSLDVFFTDGTSTKGTVLVGSDGSSSKVRQQLLNGFKAAPSRYTSILGSVTVDIDLSAKLLGESNSGLLVADKDQKANCLVLDHNKDGTDLFCWVLAYKVAEYEKEHMWARMASPEELFEKAKERTAHWPDFMRETVKRTGPEGMYRPFRLLETVLEKDELPRGRVTLLGDAMHSMLPFRGMGANTGISGACLLGKSLLDGLKQDTSVDDILRAYEREWIPKSREVVLESRAAGAGDENADLSGGRIENGGP